MHPRIAHRLAALTCLLLAAVAAGAPPAFAAEGEGIRIRRAPAHAESYLLAEALPAADTGWVYRFAVSVSAPEPVLGVTINGETREVPYAREVRAARTLMLQPGRTRVVVRAFTETRSARRTFVLELDVPPEERAHLERQEILIFRPADASPVVVRPEAQLEVPGGGAYYLAPGTEPPVRGGLMYPMVVEVSAFAPLRTVRVRGRVVARPGRTWVRVVAPVLLRPGLNEVHVEAATAAAAAERTFRVELAAEPLPGTPFYVSRPAQDAADGPP